MIEPSKGVRLAIDVGTVRIGVARSDRDQIMALPVATISASADAVTEVLKLAAEYEANLVYVGKPITLKSAETKSTLMSIDFAQKLANALSPNVLVRLLDERLTTVSAQAQIHASGKNSKQGKNVIDQVAAIVLLDHAMSIEKSTGTLAGESVTPIDPQ